MPRGQPCPAVPLYWRAAAVENDVIELDTRGLNCPMPLLKARQALSRMAAGERLQVLASDPGSWRDFRVFAEQSGHRLVEREESDGVYRYLIEKS